MGIALSPQAQALFAEKVFAHVATLMKDGSPQVTPVWVETDGTDIVINSANPGLKVRNLRRDSRVALSIMGLEDPQRCLFVRGRMREITVEGALDQISRLSAKYTGNPAYQGFREGETRMTIRIEPQKVLESRLS
jgi:PPOX class probable F420-dependent enzyme